MTTTPTHFEELGELYLGTLVANAHYGGGAATIADAVLAGFNLPSWEMSEGLIREHCRAAAAKLTHDAMGWLENTIGTIDQDYLKQRRDWNRIDAFWDSRCDSPEQEALEAVYVYDQLTRATEQAWEDYGEHCHADWAHDISRAADCLGAAARLLKEGFQITEAKS